MYYLKLITWAIMIFCSVSLLMAVWQDIRSSKGVTKHVVVVAIYFNVIVLVVFFSHLSVFNLWWMLPLMLFISIALAGFLKIAGITKRIYNAFFTKFWVNMIISGILTAIIVMMAFLLN